MRLAGAQVLHLQAEVDRQLSLLSLHRLERTREGASSRTSKTHIKRINKGRKAVRSLLLNWEYWYRLRQPGCSVPAYAVEDVLRGTPPWRPSGVVPAVWTALQSMRWRCGCTESAPSLRALLKNRFSSQARLPTH